MPHRKLLINADDIILIRNQILIQESSNKAWIENSFYSTIYANQFIKDIYSLQNYEINFLITGPIEEAAIKSEIITDLLQQNAIEVDPEIFKFSCDFNRHLDKQNTIYIDTRLERIEETQTALNILINLYTNDLQQTKRLEKGDYSCDLYITNDFTETIEALKFLQNFQ